MTRTGLPGGPAASMGPRSGGRRDRRGRGMRGPEVLPGPLTPCGVPRSRTAKGVFDDIMLGVVHRLADRWPDELGVIEFAVEEIPILPDDWSTDTVPLASLVRGDGVTPTRLVLFRKPIDLRCEGRLELGALVHTVVVEQLSELLGRAPEEIDPDYDPDA